MTLEITVGLTKDAELDIYRERKVYESLGELDMTCWRHQ